MNPAKTEAILREHVRLCSDLHQLFIEEGQLMRSTGEPPSEEFLEKKKKFVGVLDKGLELLRMINESDEPVSPILSPLVKECRDKIMKLMIVDRENERLLLKCSLPPRMKEAYSKVAPGQVARAYGKFAK
ncbi:hypothetical protein IEN85_18070 [Pelagicoccus sp. NFK12]|uniref:Uncharacterized protein n=1 Tax=Pelagicoccus enzymogenes TaxID=2773457 RepID=A0A927FDH6_9BACT|nr:hypothetical protein [Pelagicoccus enzymogenes]MBD5781413.1 hypothetical protein [Pelagicoccus enzymogenes]MDQ8199187.1 hypothetical protein [Pelagicoccus enzymogenes]